MRIKGLLLLCIVSTNLASASEKPVAVESRSPIYENEWARLDFPKSPLRTTAVEISLKHELSPDQEEEEEHLRGLWEIRYLAEKHFAERGILNRLCYSKFEAGQTPKWQVVPYPSLSGYFDNGVLRNIYSLWNQTAVLFRTIFPAKEVSTKDRARIKTLWDKSKPKVISQVVEQTGTGALNREDVIERQIIYPSSMKEENDILLLYNYAPLYSGGRQMHFLLVPNPSSPAKNFLELEEKQYVEVLSLANKIAIWAQENFPKGTTVHFFDKTGVMAGQSEPLYHAHVVIIEDESEEIWGKLSMFFRMLLPRSPIANKILEKRVSYYRETLGTFLDEQTLEKGEEIE
ncbi:MAG: diadenosine tetraphosphate (Ap4A) HIT family hydrolase [Chlamydiales bacterium]|jgi:diadenosine tetraphosphate (Ap4A) HIT family hydrolase